MIKKKMWEVESFVYEDPVSGRKVKKLTDYLGHSNHLYFTDPCWIKDNEVFIFTSDRENKSNLYSYDLNQSLITQLTYFEGKERPGGVYSQSNQAHYFWYGNKLYELDINTLDLKLLYKVEKDGFTSRKTLDVTADGKYVCIVVHKDEGQKEPAISYAYSRFEELYEKRPLTRIIRLDIKTGKTEIIHEDNCYIGHLNASPTRSELFTFCHEGPWDRVSQRMWGLNVVEKKVWKLRPQEENEAVGHEYWLQDGERVGYHGRRIYEQKQDNEFFGVIKWDNTENIEFDFPYHSTHFHSNDENIMVGDGSSATGDMPYIMLFKKEKEEFVEPRVLAFHRSTFNDQHAHPHPRFTPDGNHVIYSSDLTSYSNIYIVETGDFYDLPTLKETLK
ncbi:MAG: oligogalacturonate lyase family protein [Bacillota bacterium]